MERKTTLSDVYTVWQLKGLKTGEEAVGVPKLYLETTTFNFYHLEKDSEKKRDTSWLFKRIAEGWFEPYTTIVVIDELKTLNMAGLVNVRRDYPQIGLFSPTEVRDDDGR
jgi:hypothetical protein